MRPAPSASGPFARHGGRGAARCRTRQLPGVLVRPRPWSRDTRDLRGTTATETGWDASLGARTRVFATANRETVMEFKLVGESGTGFGDHRRWPISGITAGRGAARRVATLVCSVLAPPPPPPLPLPFTVVDCGKDCSRAPCITSRASARHGAHERFPRSYRRRDSSPITIIRRESSCGARILIRSPSCYLPAQQRRHNSSIPPPAWKSVVPASNRRFSYWTSAAFQN